MFIGRASEAAYLAYDQFYWDYDFQALRAQWPECKTADIKESLSLSDMYSYKLDQHWLYFVLFMLDLNVPSIQYTNEKWVFPQLHAKEEANKGAAATIITNSMTRLLPTPENLKDGNEVCHEMYTDNCSSKSLRRGAVQTMARDCLMQDVACKTGHFFPQISTLWEYFECNAVSLYRTTAVLSGFRQDSIVHPPDLRCIRQSEAHEIDARISNWISSLLESTHPLCSLPELKPILDVWLATFLMYLPEFNEDCNQKYSPNKDHYIIKVFKEKSAPFFQYSKAIEFGKLLRNQFKEKNGMSRLETQRGDEAILQNYNELFSQNADLRNQLVELHQHQQQDRSMIAALSSDVASLKELIVSQNDMLINQSRIIQVNLNQFRKHNPGSLWW